MRAHGRYTIVGKLADGGMAEIFLAIQHGAEGFEKPVILKRILTAFSADAQFRNMFIDEAHISMSLTHGNIAQVLDLGVSRGRYFLVLELVDGWDLHQILERARAASVAFPPALALYITAEVCRALAYAHGKVVNGRPLGIVHRDISPNNVLLSEQGEVKLADFGIAKAQHKRERTAAGIVKGKIQFMSPEQASGVETDRRSDIFSVGSMLYLMITGRLPFEAPTDLESMLKVQRAEFPPPEAAKPDMSPQVAAVIARAMRRDPSERYQSADEMLLEVERLIRSQYQSAGQTELKLWLAQLGRRDNAPSVGKLAAAGRLAPAPETEDGITAGTSFELRDLEGAAEAGPEAPEASPHLAAPPAPPAGATIAELTPPPVGAPGVAPPRDPAADIPTPPPSALHTLPPRYLVTARPAPVRRVRSGLIVFLLGGVVALVAVVAVKDLGRWLETQSLFDVTASAPDAGLRPAGPAPAAPRPATPNRPVAGPELAPTPMAQATRSDAASGASDTGVATARNDASLAAAAREEPVAGADGGAESDDDVDEEALLKDVRRDDHPVVGEDEAEPADDDAPSAADRSARGAATTASKVREQAEAKTEAKARAKADGKPEPKTSTRAATRARRDETVSVRLASRPVGAVVKTKQRVLGRTPLNVKFKSGNTYELTFVKTGYATAKKRISLADGKDRKVTVALAKKRKASRPTLFRLHPRR